MKELIEGKINIFNLEVKYKAELVRIEDLINEDVIERCKQCKSYGKNYSCPPLAPSINSFRQSYERIFVYAFYTKAILAEWENLYGLVFRYGLEIESYLGGMSFIAENCKLCNPCKAQLNESCPYPEKMRYSFTGVGLDAEKLSKLAMHKIEWGENPNYISAIGGCLTNKQGNDEVFELLPKTLKSGYQTIL